MALGGCKGATALKQGCKGAIVLWGCKGAMAAEGMCRGVTALGREVQRGRSPTPTRTAPHAAAAPLSARDL